MKFSWILSTGAVLAGLFFLTSGCRVQEAPEYQSLPPVTEEMRSRGRELVKLWEKEPLRAVLLRELDLSLYHNCRKDLVERLKLLQVNYVYMNVESADLFSWGRRDLLLDMIESLGEVGIRSDLVLVQEAFLEERHRGGRSADRLLEEVFDEAVRINRRLPDEYPAAGITIRPCLHLLTGSNLRLPVGQMYRWSEDDYGIGSDNDLMIKDFIKCLNGMRLRAHEENLKFSVVLPAFYHERAVKGDLELGKSTDFLKHADRIIVTGHGNVPSEYLASLRGLYKGVGEPNIICGLVFSDHVSRQDGSLRRRDWRDFLRITGYMQQNLNGSPAWGGMALVPFQSINFLLGR